MWNDKDWSLTTEVPPVAINTDVLKKPAKKPTAKAMKAMKAVKAVKAIQKKKLIKKPTAKAMKAMKAS